MKKVKVKGFLWNPKGGTSRWYQVRDPKGGSMWVLLWKKFNGGWYWKKDPDKKGPFESRDEAKKNFEATVVSD